MLGWLRRRRRRQILREPMPKAWRQIIRDNVKHYEKLTPREQAKLEDDARVFAATKSWDGGHGVEITDEVKLTIAAQACLMVLGFDDSLDRFYNVREIVVLESAYNMAIGQERDGAADTHLGHTYHGGPVYLAWDTTRHGGRDPSDGRNLVYHEFAHKLDLDDGLADGTPRLHGQVELDTWIDVMTAAYEELCAHEASGRPTLLDQYGSTNSAEFFAVATECFFEQAPQLKREHPEVYRMLAAYYQQDPASR
ncbi:MAG: M90 family metallopeptidase [Planctomycetota bacterium]